MTKHWIPVALAWLTQSLEPVPHELNELDWKAALKAVAMVGSRVALKGP